MHIELKIYYLALLFPCVRSVSRVSQGVPRTSEWILQSLQKLHWLVHVIHRSCHVIKLRYSLHCLISAIKISGEPLVLPMTVSKTRDRRRLVCHVRDNTRHALRTCSFPHPDMFGDVVPSMHCTLHAHTCLMKSTSLHALFPSPLKPPATPLSSRPPSSPSRACTRQSTTSRRSSRSRNSRNHPQSGSSQSASRPDSRYLYHLRSHCTRFRTRHI